MGNSNSAAAIQNFKQEYQEVKTEYNQHLGEITIFKLRSNPNILVMAKEKLFQNPEHIHFFQQELNKRQRINTDNLATLLNVLSNPSKKFYEKKFLTKITKIKSIFFS